MRRVSFLLVGDLNLIHIKIQSNQLSKFSLFYYIGVTSMSLKRMVSLNQDYYKLSLLK
jgi:hypothetical protein